MTLRTVDGTTARRAATHTADVVVVGSGPAGSAVAREVARSGAKVLVVEAGPLRRPVDFHPDALGSMADLYVELGGQMSRGRAPMPLVRGQVVGGTSVINGAICWRLPRDVWAGWVAAQPELAEALPWAELEVITGGLEAELGIAPTDPTLAGPNNLLLGRGAEALGLAHRPIRRNVVGCEGLGRCMSGCPQGRKRSMDRSLLVEACAAGAVVHHNAAARRVLVERGRVVGLAGRTVGGAAVIWRAPKVVLAASAVSTPALLLASGLRHGSAGRGFMAHPGAAVIGHYPEPVRMWQGATQGHEVTGLRAEGLKFEALGYDRGLMATRQKGVGPDFAAGLASLAHQAHWGVALRAAARGRVGLHLGKPGVRYDLLPEDVLRLRRGVATLCRLHFAAGATRVEPGVYGAPPVLTDAGQVAALDEGPTDARAYALAATHFFGGALMGADPARSVVGLGFEHHGVAGLFVADSSVFPSNTGVNPMLSILAVATLCGRAVARA